MTARVKQKLSLSQYTKIHSTLKHKYGKATKCENAECRYKNPRRFEWALKKGHKYSTDRDDFIQLCPSCHRKYDETEERRQKLSNNHKGIIYHNRTRPIIQLDTDLNFISEYDSTQDASRKTGISRTGIFNQLAGRTKSCGGYIWRYK